MIPYPSDRMILNSEYDRGYSNGQRDILETLKHDITTMKNGYPPSADEYKALNVVLEIIDKFKMKEDFGDYPGVVQDQFDNMTGSMNL